MIIIKLILIFPLILGLSLDHNSSELKLAVIFSNCTRNLYRNVQVETNVQWIIDRLNQLDTFEDHKITHTFYTGCTEEHYFEILYDFSRLKHEHYLIGALTDAEPTGKVRDFAEILEIDLERFTTTHFDSFLIRSTIGLLEKLNWDNNVTLFTPTKDLMEEFFSYSRFKLICVKKTLVYQNNSIYNSSVDEGPFVLFGNSNQLTSFLSNNEAIQDSQLVVVPTDGFVINDLGEKTFIILPSQLSSISDRKSSKYLPAPTISRFFETAQPILSYTEFLKTFIKMHCSKNQTATPLDCLKNKTSSSKPHHFESVGYDKETILKILKIEQMQNNFVYDIFRVEKYAVSTNLKKTFTYNIFDGSTIDLYNLNSTSNGSFCAQNLHVCSAQCVNFARIFERENVDSAPSLIFEFEFRSEAWVLVFLAISVIGIILSLLILSFFSICIYRKDVLEGNPITTIFLLITVLVMYSCVVFFAISVETPSGRNTVCFLKILTTTFSFSTAFALILSRAILLSTVTKEIAYMSHIPGAVQTFLALFIIAVQVALNLPVINMKNDNNSCEIYHSVSFLYLMSYNIVLLMLVLVLAPFIFSSKRNYKEGRYFAISGILITVCWCFWISAFKVLNDDWKDVTVCFALISTAIIIQGVVLVSRTYLMTVSSVRNKYRANNNFPGFNGRNSALDIYRSQERRVYDHVNVATINTTNSNIDMVTDLDADVEDEDIYNYPTLPRDEEINFDVQTNSSTYTSDKVTRF